MSQLPSLGRRGEGWVAVQMILLALVAWSGLLGPAWTNGLRLASSSVGLVLIAAGLMLAGLGLRHLSARDALTPLPHPRDDARFVQTGAYAIVRHPVYSGLIAGATGWGLLAASPATLVVASVLFAFFELKSRREEAWLMHRYGEYADYRARTPRLIPWIGGSRD